MSLHLQTSSPPSCCALRLCWCDPDSNLPRSIFAFASDVCRIPHSSLAYNYAACNLQVSPFSPKTVILVLENRKIDCGLAKNENEKQPTFKNYGQSLDVVCSCLLCKN